MLEGLVNRYWQVLVRSIFGGRQSKIGIKRLRKLGRKKPSLIVAIGKGRKGNALGEYQRRFASIAAQGNEPAADGVAAQSFAKHPPLEQSFHAKAAEPAKAGHGARVFQSGYRRALRLKRRLSGRLRHSLDAAPAFLLVGLLRAYAVLAGLRPGKVGLVAVTALCAAALGGAYVYRAVKAGGDVSIPSGVTVNAAEEKPDSRSYSTKLFHDRLPAVETGTATASEPGPPADVEPPVSSTDAQVHSGRPEAVAGGPEVAATPQPAAAGKPVTDAPTVVRSESYLPDGTRTDLAVAPVPANAKLAALEPGAAPSAPPAPQAAAQLEAQAEPGYFAQVRSDQDLKAAEAEVANVVEKYKSVLAGVPLKARQVDLKEKGIWFRVLAGPLKTYGEAESLCKKMKKAGLPACIVQKFD